MSKNLKYYSVLIIGGGPAGCAAAIFLAKQKIPVALFEREIFPRERPGEALHPGIEPLLKQLDVYAGLTSIDHVRYPGVAVKWDQAEVFQPFNNDANDVWLGYQVPRAALDHLLLNQAQALGVVIKQSANVQEIICKDGRVVGIKCDNEEYLADYVIDATGMHQLLARQLKLPGKKYSKPLLVRYGYAEGYCAQRIEKPKIIADAHGWLWTARIASNLYQWTRLVFNSNHLPKTNWLPEEFTHLKPLGLAKGADVTWRKLLKPSGAGYFITGEAAFVLDPASSHGVLKAIMSGIRAADLIAKITSNPSLESQAYREYNKWLDDWFMHDVKHLVALYQKLSKIVGPTLIKEMFFENHCYS